MRPENLLMRILVLGETSFGIGGSLNEAIGKLATDEEPIQICAITLDLGADWQVFATPVGDVELPGAVVGFIDLAMARAEDDVATYLDS